MLKSALSVFLFCLLGRLDCKDLTAKRGENATLECFGSKNATEVMIQWRKTYSHKAVNVIIFKDEKFHESQDDSFKGRVTLTDPKWNETEDFTLNLTYVILNDTGIYQCKAGYRGQGIKVLNTINLTVESKNTSITARSGENCLLPCHNPNNDLILAVRWSRPDLEPKHVVSYQEGKFDLEDQHPYFKNRVVLEGKKMKDGDVSLTLNNVMINDTGTYECHVVWKGTRHMKRADLEADPISIIYLSVSQAQTGGDTEDGGKEDGGEKSGSVGLIVGLSVSAVLVVVGAVFIYRTYRRRQNPDYRPPVDQGL